MENLVGEKHWGRDVAEAAGKGSGTKALRPMAEDGDGAPFGASSSSPGEEGWKQMEPGRFPAPEKMEEVGAALALVMLMLRCRAGGGRMWKREARSGSGISAVGAGYGEEGGALTAAGEGLEEEGGALTVASGLSSRSTEVVQPVYWAVFVVKVAGFAERKRLRRIGPDLGFHNGPV